MIGEPHRAQLAWIDLEPVRPAGDVCGKDHVCNGLSEERCGSGNPLEIFVCGRIDEGDAELMVDKPVGLL